MYNKEEIKSLSTLSEGIGEEYDSLLRRVYNAMPQKGKERGRDDKGMRNAWVTRALTWWKRDQEALDFLKRDEYKRQLKTQKENGQ